MNLSPIQSSFYRTLQEGSFRESSLFEISIDEAKSVLFNRALFREKNCNQTVTNAMGWLKMQDEQHKGEHRVLVEIVNKIFGRVMVISFESPYICVDGLTPDGFLFRAIEEGNLEDIKFILARKDLDPNAFRMQDGETPLTLACQFGNPEIVRALVEDPRVDPNLFDQGWCLFPFYHAVNNNYFEVVRELLKHPKLDPNQSKGPAYPAIILCIFHGYSEILELISQDPRTDLHLVKTDQNNSPLQRVLTLGTPEIKKMGERTYKVNPKKDDSKGVLWKTFAFLPVSSDKSHTPPDDYFNGLKVVDTKMFRNDRYGELEIDHLNELTRVIYRTVEFVTVSVLWNNHPLGPTIYKPICSLTTEIKTSPNIWHIANRAISKNPQVLHEILSDLAAKKLIVLRSLNEDNDQKRILQGEGLRGRGASTKVSAQVKGNDTALVSASDQPISTFLKGHKRRNNGGYVAIFTQKGGRIFIDFKGQYPKFLSHREVLEEVSHDARLTMRAKNAKECIFYPEIPLEVVALLDGGYPRNEEGGKGKKENTKPLPRRVQNLLTEGGISYGSLSDEIKKMLHSNKKLRVKVKLLNASLSKDV